MIEKAGRKIAGKVVNLSARGMLVQSEMTPPVGAEIDIEFSVSGPTGEFAASVRGVVAWIQPGRVGIQFLEGPPGLTELLEWLERERYYWSDAG